MYSSCFLILFQVLTTLAGTASDAYHKQETVARGIFADCTKKYINKSSQVINTTDLKNLDNCLKCYDVAAESFNLYIQMRVNEGKKIGDKDPGHVKAISTARSELTTLLGNKGKCSAALKSLKCKLKREGKTVVLDPGVVC